MYHSVSDDREYGTLPYYRLCTDPRRFAEQLQWISDFGYRGVSLEEALNQLSGDGACSGAAPVAITFDDGYRDFLTAAWPALARHNFTATVYVSTGFIASPRRSLHGRECLTWEEIRELRRAGIRFGSHTVSHTRPHQLHWPAIREELIVSKDKIEQQLQEQSMGFAYPFAFPQADRAFVARFTHELREAGYKHCATTKIGRISPGDSLYSFPRLPINGMDDHLLFGAKLTGTYDWMGSVQAAKKNLRVAWSGIRGISSRNPKFT